MDLRVVSVLLAVFGSALSDADEKYFKRGGSVEFHPVLVSPPITSLQWFHKGNLVSEWVEDLVPLEYNGLFKNRSEVDLKSGRLRVWNMVPENRGLYTVEINNLRQTGGFMATYLEEVPVPNVLLRPLSCNHKSDKCSLKCDGDIDRAGPVTFFWKRGESEKWEKLDQVLEIPRQGETKRPESYSCRMENPVSTKDSPSIQDPFQSPSDSSWIIASVLVPLLLAVFGLLLYCLRNREPFKSIWDRLCPARTNEGQVPEHVGLVNGQPGVEGAAKSRSGPGEPSNGRPGVEAEECDQPREADLEHVNAEDPPKDSRVDL